MIMQNYVLILKYNKLMHGNLSEHINDYKYPHLKIINTLT